VALLDVFNLPAVFDAIKRILGPFGKLFDILKKSFDELATIIERSTKLLDGIIAEAKAWQNFKQDIRFKSRVINLESAIEKTRALIEGIPAAWRSIQDIFKQFKEQFPTAGNPAAEAEALIEDVEAEGGVKALLKKFPKLAKGLEKVLGVLALVLQALESISKTVDDLQTILDEITRLRLEVEKLDTIFLSQSNKRARVKLADGKSIRIRVGKLHTAGL